MTGGSRTVRLLNYTFVFALQLRKSTKNIIQFRGIMFGTTRYVDLAPSLSLDCNVEHQSSSVNGG
jgi:hypothetical protein